MKGKIFINTSGKYIQFPNRLSDDFKWSPMEKIQIIEEMSVEHTNAPSEEGYSVLNLDYVGHENAFMTAWISKECLKNNFKELTILK